MSSKIFKKAFYNALILVLVYLILVFSFLVPYIEKNSITLEERTGEIELKKTVEIVRNSGLEMKAYATLALERHKENLVRLTSIAKQIIEFKEKESHGLSAEGVRQKQKEALDIISQLTYNHDDYFYVSNYKSVLIAHPYLRNKDFSQIKDIDGQLIVPPLVDVAREKGSGFVEYRWKKNKTDNTIYHKLTYAENFKPWSWVVGTGVYIDDIDKEVTLRKLRLIQRLKKLLRKTKIGKNGYLYIFNSHAKMIIHQDKNLEGKYIQKMPNPQTNTLIFDDLVNAYRQGNKTLYYVWDAPNDRGNYIYKKVSWIDYDNYFDWYICSSGYLKDFHHHSEELRSYLLYAIPLITLFITLLGLYLIRKILQPVIELSEIAKKVGDGALHLRYSGEIPDDEIGILAKQFNYMLDTIHEQVETLDFKVKEKTQALSHSLKEKEILLKEIHHRVKNNLFTISSIIGLQEFCKKEMSASEIIVSIQNRIQAIAMAHDMLSRENNEYQRISMPKYIKQLISAIMSAMENNDKYRVISDIEPISLPLEKTLTIGLIINELVTNAIKYAFGGSKYQITVSMHSDKKGGIILLVKDTGKGFDLSSPKGTGLDLVEMSAMQLNGKMVIESKNGTAVYVLFPYET